MSHTVTLVRFRYIDACEFDYFEMLTLYNYLKNQETNRRIVLIFADLNQLYKRKGDLMADYDRQCQDYWQATKSSRLGAPPLSAECPTSSVTSMLQLKQQIRRTASGKRDEDSDSEQCPARCSAHPHSSHVILAFSGDYELFSAEKRMCRTLIAYVQNFLAESSCAECEKQNNVLRPCGQGCIERFAYFSSVIKFYVCRQSQSGGFSCRADARTAIGG